MLDVVGKEGVEGSLSRGTAASQSGVWCVSTYICVPPAQYLVQSGPLFAPRSRRGGAAHLVKSCPYYSLPDLNIVK